MINHTEPIISEKRRTIHGLGLGLDKAVVGYGIGSQSGKEANEDNYWPHEREDERYVLPKYDHIIDY